MLTQPQICQNSFGLVYHYPNQPKIIIRNGRLHTLQSDITKFGEKKCQHQATILLRLLYYPKSKRNILNATRKTVTFARLVFLKKATTVNKVKNVGNFEFTLLRHGEYKPDKYYRVGFDLKMKNNSNPCLLDLDAKVVGINKTRSFPNKREWFKKNQEKEIHYHSTRLKTRTQNYKIVIDYKFLQNNGKIVF